MDRPSSSKSAEAALKSGDAAMTELMQQRQRGVGGGRDDIIGRRGIMTDATTATIMTAGGNDDGLWMNRGENSNRAKYGGPLDPPASLYYCCALMQYFF